MLNCPKCSALYNVRDGFCNHCGWAQPGRALVPVSDQVPSTVAVDRQANGLRPSVDYPRDRTVLRDNLSWACGLVTMAIMFGGVAWCYHFGDQLRGDPRAFAVLFVWVLVMHGGHKLGMFLILEFNEEYEEFDDHFQQVLQEASSDRFFANENILLRMAQHQTDVVLEREGEFLGMSDQRRSQHTDRFYNFIQARFDDGGREIMAYVTEGRRVVQAAYYFRSRQTPLEMVQQRATLDAEAELTKARVGALGETVLEAEIDQLMEQLQATKKSCT